MKRQAPISKLQRNAKTGATATKKSPVKYPESNGHSWGLEENDATTTRHPFDLEERTALFGENVIRFLKRVPSGPRTGRLIDQLTGCGTSAGANYCEANEGLSKKGFRNIIGRCRKEAKESKFFFPNDCHCRALFGRRSTHPLPRSQGTTPHLLQHLPQGRILILNSTQIHAHDIDHRILLFLWSLDIGA